MQFLSLEPFVPSGPDFEGARQFFQELGFAVSWDGGDYIGFASGACRFILQKFDRREFAENFMVSVGIDSADDFYRMVLQKRLPERFGIRIQEPAQQPYGREVNIIDAAGVCWHFVEQEKQ